MPTKVLEEQRDIFVFQCNVGCRVGDQLLPFISEQNYNDNIKAAFKVAGISRLVTELDPVTRKEVKHPLNEIASSLGAWD